MPFPVYSTEFQAITQLTPGAATVYAVPAGFTAVLRDVDVFCQAGVSAGSLYLHDWFTNIPFWFLTPPNAGGPTYAKWEGRQVFKAVAGQAVGWYWATDPSGSNTFTIRASGYLLSQP